MKELYLILNIASISIPFLATFHPRLRFYRKWKYLLPGLFISSTFYICWDIIFTQFGIWGFNEDYYIGFRIANLPLEEILFFICIPYACVFTHYALLELFPKLAFPDKYLERFTGFLILASALLCLLFYDRWYTTINFAYCALLLTAVYKFQKTLLRQYLATFLFMLIPFFIVNGILTGTGIEGEVVWYNHEENLNIRIGTIPIEDAMYAFTLVLTNLALMSYLKKNRLMAFYQFYREQQLNTTIDKIWEFISSPANLKDITPDHMGFDITTKNIPEKMYQGMIIGYKVSPLFGIKTTWVTEITHLREKQYFVDEQRIGPYTLWHHQHIIEPLDRGILMKDIVSYQPPLGILGIIANRLIIRKKLEEIFDYRKVVLEKRFGVV